MTFKQWSQWVDESNGVIYACLTTAPRDEFDDESAMMVAKWTGDDWDDISKPLVPTGRQPNAMEHIAMWSLLPDTPGPELLQLQEQINETLRTSAGSPV